MVNDQNLACTSHLQVRLILRHRRIATLEFQSPAGSRWCWENALGSKLTLKLSSYVPSNYQASIGSWVGAGRGGRGGRGRSFKLTHFSGQATLNVLVISRELITLKCPCKIWHSLIAWKMSFFSCEKLWYFFHLCSKHKSLGLFRTARQF